MTDALTAWQAWQREHSDVLAELQEKQRAYHREVAAQALGGSSNPDAAARLKTFLNAVEAVRIRLDDIRAKRPPAD